MTRLTLVILLGGILLCGGCRRANQPEPANENAKPTPQSKASVVPTPVVPGAAAPTAEESSPAATPPVTPTPDAAAPAVRPQMAGEDGLPAQSPGAAPVPQANGAPVIAPAAPFTPKERPGIKTRIVRSLLDALDGIQGLEDGQKQGLVDSLVASDEELSRVLGGNSKELILRANKKPSVPIFGEEPRPMLILPDKPAPVVVPAPVPVVPAPPAGPAPAADAAANAAAPNAAVQSLLNAVDGLQNEDPAVKEQLKKAILDADKRLRAPAGSQP